MPLTEFTSDMQVINYLRQHTSIDPDDFDVVEHPQIASGTATAPLWWVKVFETASGATIGDVQDALAGTNATMSS